MICFEGWPKTQRLSNTTIAITEKIDGTNAAVVIERTEPGSARYLDSPGAAVLVQCGENEWYEIAAQSRKRLIRVGDDNFGFARWVLDNAHELVELLGPGRHFGEWWGQGIQRGYGMSHKVFSLFNQHRWFKIAEQREDWKPRASRIHMTAVPLLYAGTLDLAVVDYAVELLRQTGSVAPREWVFDPSFQKAEGVVTYFPHLDVRLKSFVENDTTPKGEA